VESTETRRRREKLRKQLSWFYRMRRQIETATILKVRRAVPPLYPGMYPPSTLLNQLEAAARKALAALSEIRDSLERYETIGIAVEKARVASLLETIRDCRKEFYRITRIAYAMKEREDERIKRGRERLIELELAGAPERELVETRAAMHEAEIGSRQYAQVIDASRLMQRMVDEGLEGMKESIEAIGLEIPR